MKKKLTRLLNFFLPPWRKDKLNGERLHHIVPHKKKQKRGRGKEVRHDFE